MPHELIPSKISHIDLQRVIIYALVSSVRFHKKRLTLAKYCFIFANSAGNIMCTKKKRLHNLECKNENK